MAELTRSGIQVADFSLGQPSLDEVFLALTGHTAEDQTEDGGTERRRPHEHPRHDTHSARRRGRPSTPPSRRRSSLRERPAPEPDLAGAGVRLARC